MSDGACFQITSIYVKLRRSTAEAKTGLAFISVEATCLSEIYSLREFRSHFQISCNKTVGFAGARQVSSTRPNLS